MIKEEVGTIDILSDHGVQIFGASLIKDSKQCPNSYHIATWNTLNKKASAKTLGGDHSNNPENKDENDEQYIARRLKQFEKIVGLMKETDVISLQEFDCLFPIGKERKTYPELQQKFKDILKEQGWALVTPQHPNPFAIRKTIMLYNTQVFDWVSQDNVLPVEKKIITKNGKEYSNTQYAGLAVNLKDKSNSELKTCFVSMHLDYDHNYGKDIGHFLKQNTKKDIMTVMVGDTNRPQNKGEHYNKSIIDWNYATAYRYDKEKKAFSVEHKDDLTGSVRDAIDTCSAAPTKKTQILIEEKYKEYFEIVEKEPVLYSVKPQSNHKHLSLPGYYWERRIATAYKLQTAFDECSKLDLDNENKNKVLEWKSTIFKIMNSKNNSEEKCKEIMKLLEEGTGNQDHPQLQKICKKTLDTVFLGDEIDQKISKEKINKTSENPFSFHSSQPQKETPKEKKDTLTAVEPGKCIIC